MRRYLAALPIALVLFAGAAAPAYAVVDIPLLNPSFSIVPAGCINCPCTFGEVLQLAQNLINAAIGVGVIAMILVIAYAGAMFMLNPTKPEARSQARKMFINVVVGMVIVLSAWLVVDFIMKTIYVGESGNNASYGPWNSILVDTSGAGPCIVAKAVTPISTAVGSIAQSALTGTNANQQTAPSTANVGAGTCPAVTSGPCSMTNLTPTFGANATQFSKICYNESRGTSIASTVDIGTDGQPVSFGLFQINISANPVGRLNCPAAFNTPYVPHNANGTHVTNQTLYSECKTAALDPATNIQTAQALFQQEGGFTPAWNGDQSCAGF